MHQQHKNTLGTDFVLTKNLIYEYTLRREKRKLFNTAARTEKQSHTCRLLLSRYLGTLGSLEMGRGGGGGEGLDGLASTD